jgi:hypothetical protein
MGFSSSLMFRFRFGARQTSRMRTLRRFLDEGAALFDLVAHQDG